MDISNVIPLISLATLLWAIVKFRSQQRTTEKHLERQREQSEELVRLTSNLQMDVEHLNTKLGYSIKQLERIVEVTRAVHLLMYGDKNIRALEPGEAGKINTYRMELKALARVLNDEKLFGRVKNLFDLIDASWEKQAESEYEKWNETQIEISVAAEELCERAFELMQERLNRT